MRKFTGVIAMALLMALLFSTSTPAAESPVTAVPAASSPPETLYVRIEPSVALLAMPSDTATPAGELAPGDAVTVLGRQAGFVNVRAGGVQGWLRETELTSVAPPAARVAELEQELSRLRAELATARDALDAAEARLRQAREAAANARASGADASAALQAENTALREQLAAAGNEVSRLKARLAEIETNREVAREAAQLLAAQQPAEGSIESPRFSRVEIGAGLAAAIGLPLLGVWFGISIARRRLRRRYHGLEL